MPNYLKQNYNSKKTVNQMATSARINKNLKRDRTRRIRRKRNFLAVGIQCTAFQKLQTLIPKKYRKSRNSSVSTCQLTNFKKGHKRRRFYHSNCKKDDIGTEKRLWSQDCLTINREEGEAECESIGSTQFPSESISEIFDEILISTDDVLIRGSNGDTHDLSTIVPKDFVERIIRCYHESPVISH